MKRSEEEEPNVPRLYSRLNSLISRLNKLNQQSVRLNLDVPVHQSTNLIINIKNHASVGSSGQLEQTNLVDQADQPKEYYIKINTAQRKQAQPLDYTSSYPQCTVNAQKVFSKQSQVQQGLVTQIKPSSTAKSNVFGSQIKGIAADNQANQAQAWKTPIKSAKTPQNNEKIYPSSGQLSQSSLNKDAFAYSISPSYHSASYQNSQTLLSNLTTEMKVFEEKLNQNLTANNKITEEYTHRLHNLNQKLKNTFIRVHHPYHHFVAVETAKQKLKQNKSHISPINKTLSSNYQKISKQKSIVSSFKKIEAAKNSRIMLNQSQCSCQGQRIRRSKRSISPFFNHSDYKFSVQENIYKKTPPKNKESSVQKNSTVPSNRRNVKLSSESMSKFINDVRVQYKERIKTQIQEVNYQTTDRDKKYTAHRLYRSPLKSTKTEKKPSHTRSISPLLRYQHRCLACCNYP